MVSGKTSNVVRGDDQYRFLTRGRKSERRLPSLISPTIAGPQNTVQRDGLCVEDRKSGTLIATDDYSLRDKAEVNKFEKGYEMTTETKIIGTLDAIIAQRSLLKHPFYQSWSVGTLPLPTLREYAKQYFHFEAAFPTFLSALHSRCAPGALRQAILDNLYDEEHGTENHLALWLRFCEALDLTEPEVRCSTPFAETRQLVEGFREACRKRSVAEGLAMLYAYESQAPQIAREKIVGLKLYYGIEEPSVLSFFAVHQELDAHHANAEREGIWAFAKDGADVSDLQQATQVGSELLWRFLDGAYAHRP